MGLGGSYTAEHENLTIFSTEFGKIVYNLADFGKPECYQTRKLNALKDGKRQSPNLADTDIA